MNGKYKGLAAVLIILGLVFYIWYLITPDEELQRTLLYLAGATTLLFTLMTGLLVVVFGLIQALLGFVATLPFFSSVYAWLIAIYAILYRWIFISLIRKTVGRVPFFQRLNKRIVENSTVIKTKNMIDHALVKFGLRHPRQYRIIEVGRCPYCRNWRPIDSRYCPGCGRQMRR
jgi:hypothetical protein